MKRIYVVVEYLKKESIIRRAYVSEEKAWRYRNYLHAKFNKEYGYGIYDVEEVKINTNW